MNVPSVFICHSHKDAIIVQLILESLTSEVRTWINKKNIIIGENLNNKISNVIHHDSELFLLFISENSIDSRWIKKEIKWALEREKKIKKKIFIPVILGKLSAEKLKRLEKFGLAKNTISSPYIPVDDVTDLRAYARSELSKSLRKWQIKYLKKGLKPDSLKLCVRIGEAPENLWSRLEDIAVKSVISGGITGMGYYNNVRQKKERVDLSKKNEKNPSFSADILATAAILRALDSHLGHICKQLDCELFYLGEETVYKENIYKEIGYELKGKILDGHEFFETKSNCMRVIIDAIDGTSNFDRGLPLFCSSLAIFIEDELRISAIYDPFHHVIYSALLRGYAGNIKHKSTAMAWYISSGNKVNLKKYNRERNDNNLNKEAIAVHLPRRDDRIRDEFIGSDNNQRSILQDLAENLGGIYSLNSGLLALTEVAKGTLLGFVNIKTNPWDVAAGQVLVEACGGIVTDYEGEEISYQSHKETGVIAAKNAACHNELLNIIKNKGINKKI